MSHRHGRVTSAVTESIPFPKGPPKSSRLAGTRWTLGWGNFGTRHDDEAPQAFHRGEHMGRMGFDPRSLFPCDGRSPFSHPTCDVPFPPRRSGRYRKGMISAHPSYQGVRSVDRFGILKPSPWGGGTSHGARRL